MSVANIPSLNLVGPQKSSAGLVYEAVKNKKGEEIGLKYRHKAIVFYKGDNVTLYDLFFDFDESFEAARKAIEKGLKNPQLYSAKTPEFNERHEFLYRVQIDRNLGE